MPQKKKVRSKVSKARPKKGLVTFLGRPLGRGRFLPVLAFVLLFAAGGVYLLGHSLAATPVAATGAIKSSVGKCLDAATNSSKVEVWDCNGTAPQKWSISVGENSSAPREIMLAGTDKCLVATNGGKPKGLVQAVNCSDIPTSYSSAFWKLQGNTIQVNGQESDQPCLSDPNNSTSNGTQLLVQSCNKSSGQSWSLPAGSGNTSTPTPLPTIKPTSSPSSSPSPVPVGTQPTNTPVPTPVGGTGSGTNAVTGPITSGISGKCMDDWHNGTNSGNKVDIYNCNGSAAQKWTVSGTENGAAPHTIKIHNMCLAPTEGGFTVDAAVEIISCASTSSAFWAAGSPNPLNLMDNGQYTDQLCLSDPAGTTQNGTQLQVRLCNASAAQSWRLP